MFSGCSSVCVHESVCVHVYTCASVALLMYHFCVCTADKLVVD